MPNEFRMYIDGEWRDALDGGKYDDINPYTGGIFARVAAGVRLQSLNPSRAAKIAALACSGVASMTLPMAVIRSIGLRSGRAVPGMVRPLIKGAAAIKAVSAVIAASRSRSAARSPNSMPREFCRCGR